MAYRRIAYFLAGTLLGATAVALSRSEKGQQLLSNAVQGACQLTETVMERVEILKEDIDDYLAEAKHTRETRLQAESASDCKEDEKSQDSKEKVSS